MPEVPDELADVSPEEFVAERDALAKKLKADGKTAEAADVKKLRKPTVTRWAADQVLRHHAADVEALRRALGKVAAAQEAAITRGDRGALADATAQRRDAIAEVERAVDDVLARSERPAHHRDEVVSTIESEVTTEVSSGTFGLRDDLDLPDRPRPAKQPARDRVAERRQAQAQAAIREAEARVERARDELARAEAALAELVERHGGGAAERT